MGHRLMIMIVMPKVLGGRTTFVLAIPRHCCPAELQGQQCKQENDQPLFHLFNNIVALGFDCKQTERSPFVLWGWKVTWFNIAGQQKVSHGETSKVSGH